MHSISQKLDQEIERLRLVQSTITRAETCLMEWQKARATADQRLAETKEIDEEVAKLPGVDAQQAISLAGVLTSEVAQRFSAQYGTFSLFY